jgi:hypothetical protein
MFFRIFFSHSAKLDTRLDRFDRFDRFDRLARSTSDLLASSPIAS